MIDHNIVNEIVFDASMAATVYHYPTEHPEYPVFDKFTRIYMMENVRQIEWLDVHDNQDVAENIKVFGRARGIQCDVKYAEGFTLLKRAGHIPTKRYLP